jgi:hypothetical protein
MSFLTVCGRGLRKMVAASAVKAVRLAVAGLIAGNFFLAEGGLTSARGDERTVLAVVTADSYADLKKQAGWLGTQVGQPGLAGMLESVLLIATQGRGLAGLDVKRPLGAVVTTDGGDLGYMTHGGLPGEIYAAGDGNGAATRYRCSDAPCMDAAVVRVGGDGE